ncbi:MAG: hypothetical protein LBT40_00395 [Deltaproteobacteria bacterium]|jgi:hypothetical protein|nr:hypothetical protein [Deltaproteobacteria bacterium]
MAEVAVSTPSVYSFRLISQALDGRQNFFKLRIFLKKEEKRGVLPLETFPTYAEMSGIRPGFCNDFSYLGLSGLTPGLTDRRARKNVKAAKYFSGLQDKMNVRSFFFALASDRTRNHATAA